MVYGILRLINFAHGDVFMVAGMMLIWCSAIMPLYLAIPTIIIATIVLGFCIERAAYLPLRKAPRMSVMISAIGVSYLLQNVITYLTGGQPMTYPTIDWLSKTVNVFGTKQTVATLVTIPAVVVLVVLLTFLINHTKVGMAMRAVSKDFETSRLMGIKINNVISVTFVIGSALAAAASLFYLMQIPSVEPTLGSMPGIKAFTAAVIGGIGSIPGAMIGGVLLGVIEKICLSIPVLAPYTTAVEFGLLIVILLVRPIGLLGKKRREKV
jgi:branched-chain amino acid transport system permease protein